MPVYTFRNSEWTEMVVQYKAIQATGKQQQQVSGQAHIQVSVKEIKGQPRHQENKENGYISFLIEDKGNKLI